MCRFSLSAVLSLVLAQVVYGATYTVTNTNDTGPDSLRQAILSANASALSDVITFSETVTGTIHLGAALPDLQGSLTIDGPTARQLTVARASNAPLFRLFTIAAPASVVISDLTISNGVAAEGGGILNRGVLSLVRVAVVANQANNSFGEGGGGLLNYGTLSLDTCVVRTNRSFNLGGGIRNVDGTLLLQDTIISENIGSAAGGLGNYGGSVTMAGCTVAANFSFDGGGGILNYFGTNRIVNCTISGNTSRSTTGGAGILASYGAVFVQFSTITSNFATLNGRGGGIRKEVSAHAFVANSIIAGNTATSGLDMFGVIDSGDHNLVGNAGGVTIRGETAHNIYDVNPLLLPLGNYGGPTPTHLLRNGSPAIDAANLAFAPAVDQRSFARPSGASPDIGAVEFSAADSDQDRLPDDFEVGHGLNPNNPADANLDYDNDSQSNRQEYTAGTDPADPASLFRVAVRRSGADVVVEFPSVAGRRYRVEYRSSLSPDASWTPLGEEMQGNGLVLEIRDTIGPSQRYYRALVTQ